MPNSFTMGLILGGLMSGLLMLAGAALIGDPASGNILAGGEDPTVGADPSPHCIVFQVGSPYAAETHIRLENGGPERVGVRLSFVDHRGRASHDIGWTPALEPGAVADFQFRAPPLGATVTLLASGAHVQASAEIVRDDGPPPETRPAMSCRAGGPDARHGPGSLTVGRHPRLPPDQYTDTAAELQLGAALDLADRG